MTKKKKDKPKNIEDALGPLTGEKTTDRIVAESMGEANVMDSLTNEQYPEGPPQVPPKEKTKKSIENPPEKKPQTTLVSNTDGQPAKETYTQESQEPQTKGDSNLRRLVEYVHSEMFSTNYVRLHLNHLSRIPAAIPSVTLWDVPGKVDVATLVYDIILTPGYVENAWPKLKILMGTSVDNVTWSIGVLTTLAVFDAIAIMPLEVRE